MEEQGEKLEHKVFTRIGKTKYNELSQMLANSPYRTMSSLVRDILVNGKITILTRDASLDDVIEKLSWIRTELNMIGVNINQVTKRIYSETWPKDRADILLEATGFNRQADKKVDDLFEILDRLAQRWLPE